ncbi:serine protease inhibitor ecotin [Serratia microhaemolytica]|uniref:serine protease inhibitor ecotin n=1 Tax=Serratia microhaemolytica TaxID=2675110 RepID=UPI000FDCEF2C|nr:serine protease inhibitor ecotin [Serratia microhaemolytica]
MKITSLASISLLVFASINSVATAAVSADDLSLKPLEKIAPFPKAEKGMSRQVIYLPKQENEENFKVELLIGKTLEVDCNRHMMGGQLESNMLTGWGYEYLVLTSISVPASTMMACIDDTRRPKFVVAHLGHEAIRRYNSRLPIVVYVPNGVEVRYRIWEASSTINKAIAK